MALTERLVQRDPQALLVQLVLLFRSRELGALRQPTQPGTLFSSLVPVTSASPMAISATLPRTEPLGRCSLNKAPLVSRDPPGAPEHRVVLVQRDLPESRGRPAPP